MKLTYLLLCAIVASAAIGVSEEPESLETLRFEFQVALAEQRKPLKEFDQKYRAQLQKLEEKMQAAGELQKLLIVRDELKEFGSGDSEGFTELERLQSIYEREKETIAKKCLDAEKPVIRAYQEKLTELQKSLTRAGKIDEALKIAAEITTLKLSESSSANTTASSMNAAGGKKPGEEFVNESGVTLCWIPPGSFLMGSPPDEPGRDPAREKQIQVEISPGFWMGKYEVTQEEYKEIMGFNPSQFTDGGMKKPVETVSWNDAEAFCGKLSELEREKGSLPKGWRYTLPSEAQWEYACRAGTETAFNNGKGITSIEGECGSLDAVGWYRSNNGGGTNVVGRKRPNQWGLYDMHGNVREWCLDWFQDERMSGSTLVNPAGPETGSQRVDRGGYWNWTPQHCRSAQRYGMSATFRGSQVGFRVALVQQAGKSR